MKHSQPFSPNTSFPLDVFKCECPKWGLIHWAKSLPHHPFLTTKNVFSFLTLAFSLFSPAIPLALFWYPTHPSAVSLLSASGGAVIVIAKTPRSDYGWFYNAWGTDREEFTLSLSSCLISQKKRAYKGSSNLGNTEKTKIDMLICIKGKINKSSYKTKQIKHLKKKSNHTTPQICMSTLLSWGWRNSHTCKEQAQPT